MTVFRTRLVRRAFIALALCRASLGAQQIPQRLADSTFWRMVTTMSEPGGYFRSDNFISNEVTFQHVIPALVSEGRAPGGVYLGVGPDQNFTYLVAMQPKIAFIFDIRRQNILQHLLYKAIIEQSTDRADFLALLFSRPRPAGLASNLKVDSLMAVYRGIGADTMLFRRNLVTLRAWLTGRHGFTIGDDEWRSIEYVYTAFFMAGPEINYSFAQSGRGFGNGFRRMPNYEELMVQTDSASVQRGYLASEELFARLKDLEERNLIVPVVGNFAGPSAIRAVGDWVRARGATVSAFYVSNVEQYLFMQGDDQKKFFDNVATLPLDDRSVFVRAFFNFGAPRGAPGGGAAGPRSVTLLGGIKEQLRAFSEGRLQTYFDLMSTSR
jgi:hypothetical protein